MINLLADKNVYLIDKFIPEGVSLRLFDPAQRLPDLAEVDCLIVQTVTKLNAHTLPNPPKRLKLIGTASSGIDHVDVDYFTKKGSKVVSAKGCNANAVAEYVITSILLWKEQFQNEKAPGKIGVIGAGSAGSAVIKLIEKFGWNYVAYDPPREEIDSEFTSVSLDEVLACDILTFHVPLTINGPHATYHWLDESKLSNRNFDLVINASRGGVIDEKALLKAHLQGNVGQIVLDVWENEPAFNDEVARKAFIATPHIAGYSVQAKTTATQMMMAALTEYFELKGSQNDENKFPKTIDVDLPISSLSSILERINPIREYDSKLRTLIGSTEKASGFRDLRNHFPFRDEYPFLKINKEMLYPELKNLGVQL